MGPAKMTRRQFMAAAGGSVVGIGLPGHFIKLTQAQNRELTGQLRLDGRPRIPPGQHAVKALLDMGGIAGSDQLDLKVYGEVDHPCTFNEQQLSRLPRIEITCDVHCVTGWTLLDSKWGGYALADVMALAGADKNSAFVIFEAPAGYASNVPLKGAGDIYLVDTFFGRRLPKANGAPLRALVPDLYFWKSVKWLHALKFSTVDQPGFYEKMGYSNSADPWKEERLQSRNNRK